ncbi:hypothetical protein HaLaN_33185 [Haematococcus lacustris]|uniref:Uncharacterized protein n=1 Tax=Haematococcus lacustris TaxID=44745 RepID=A0A6A0AQ63_HAELA|nr:hypothetical protein HaLaN_33185 [Haematococcus lacustris]
MANTFVIWAVRR